MSLNHYEIASGKLSEAGYKTCHVLKRVGEVMFLCKNSYGEGVCFSWEYGPSQINLEPVKGVEAEKPPNDLLAQVRIHEGRLFDYRGTVAACYDIKIG